MNDRLGGKKSNRNQEKMIFYVDFVLVQII